MKVNGCLINAYFGYTAIINHYKLQQFTVQNVVVYSGLQRKELRFTTVYTVNYVLTLYCVNHWITIYTKYLLEGTVIFLVEISEECNRFGNNLIKLIPETEAYALKSYVLGSRNLTFFSRLGGLRPKTGFLTQPKGL